MYLGTLGNEMTGLVVLADNWLLGWKFKYFNKLFKTKLGPSFFRANVVNYEYKLGLWLN